MNNRLSFDRAKSALSSLLHEITEIAMSARFATKYGFLPPPRGTDLVGYEALIDFMETQGILGLDGDLVEIGAFLGGGTYKLSKYLATWKSPKRIFVLDIFDIGADNTQNTNGASMSALYGQVLKGRNQWEVFCSVTKGCENVVCIKGDSMQAIVPAEKLCFAFIDGNHDADYVRNDFGLVWAKLSPGGVVAFDDYGHDLPEVTRAINELREQYAIEIARYLVRGKLIFIQKEFSS